MRYVLQVNTGSFSRSAFDSAQVVERVENCLNKLDVSDVIYGWTHRHEVHQALAELLTKRNITQYLWLPIFSEVRDSATAMPFQYADGDENDAIRLCEGEDFVFVCPSASENRLAALDTYEFLAADLPLEGVFLDRIRYPSTANSPKALLGCQCTKCQGIYQAANIDIKRIQANMECLIPESWENGRYHFDNPDAERLYKIKRDIITKAVEKLCAHFRAKGLSVGLDAFAPILADYVGQDTAELGNLVDFIKPMMYRRTNAPAGIPFEISTLRDVLGTKYSNRMAQLWGSDMLSDEVNLKQMTWLQSASHNAYPGIETNRISGICDSTSSYLLESIAQAQAADCKRVVLSWDALHMPDDILETLSKR